MDALEGLFFDSPHHRQGPPTFEYSFPTVIGVQLRGQPDWPPGAIYCSLDLSTASLGRLTRLTLSKPKVQQMAPGGLSGQRLTEYGFSQIIWLKNNYMTTTWLSSSNNKSKLVDGSTHFHHVRLLFEFQPQYIHENDVDLESRYTDSYIVTSIKDMFEQSLGS